MLCAEHRPTQGPQDRDTADLSMPARCQLQCHLQGVRAPQLQCSPEGPAVPWGRWHRVAVPVLRGLCRRTGEGGTQS